LAARVALLTEIVKGSTDMNYEDRKRRVDTPEDYDDDDFGDDYDDNFVEEGRSNASDDGNLS
jgi:hypothetical protein